MEKKEKKKRTNNRIISELATKSDAGTVWILTYLPDDKK